MVENVGNRRLHTKPPWLKYAQIHRKTTYKWYTGDMRVHTSDIRMTYKYTKVTYRLHKRTPDWHTNDLQLTSNHMGVT